MTLIKKCGHYAVGQFHFYLNTLPQKVISSKLFPPTFTLNQNQNLLDELSRIRPLKNKFRLGSGLHLSHKCSYIFRFINMEKDF